MEKKSGFPHPYFESHPNWKWFILSTVLVGATMSALDVSIVNVAMPTMEKGFQVNMAVIEWVAMAYMLTLTVFLPLFGRLADMFGRTKMYNTGFVVFTVGSALCGIAPNANFIIFSRVLQAVGAGLLQANSVAIITQAFPSNELGKAIGLQGSVQAIAMSIGPFVGGMIIAAIGWRWIFYVNVPIGIAGTFMALFILPSSKANMKKKEKIDYFGISFFAAGLAFLVLAVNEGTKLGWSSPIIITYFVIAAVFLPLFVYTEIKVEHPMIDLKLFKKWGFSAGNVTGMLSYYVLFAVLFLMPFYLENLLHYNAAATGSLLTPIPLSMAIIAPFAGAISDKVGSRIMTTLGMFVCAIATLLLSFLGNSVNIYMLIFDFIILGVGMGIFTPPNNSAIMLSAPPERLGVAGGILNMMRALGLIFGVAISGLIVSSTKHSYAKAHGFALLKDIPEKIANIGFLHGLTIVMFMLLGINVFATIMSVAKKNVKITKIEGAEPIDLM
ncbi:MAG: DHA2 family efflux MFS transporter permease subunit [Candidatus Acidulodesulfobacterium acidiphilum]|uniref:DHA2 family efflux MFS transporter permease subunit n=1 Tax=Candidatus Acidulodesulfobacterium acidiphilum TaxID=2597224 RepID=A0A520XEP9_9DELT|nr:MAG: DHA2 family efflux MFS transporter permease subunit [Candidatus Acidulodesulfobacterium acidiphilum]